jgi:hypothetical protein
MRVQDQAGTRVGCLMLIMQLTTAKNSEAQTIMNYMLRGGRFTYLLAALLLGYIVLAVGSECET